MAGRPERLYIAVSGSGEAGEEDRAWAEEIGRLIARAGAVVVCGGLGGVMEAAARGAQAEGGVAVGILPGERRGAENSHLTVAVPTGMGEGRNALVVRAADALIAVSGEFGTLSEIALALKLRVPVVGLSTWELSRAGRSVEAFHHARTPHEAVERALRLARVQARTADE